MKISPAVDNTLSAGDEEACPQRTGVSLTVVTSDRTAHTSVCPCGNADSNNNP